MNNAGTAEVVVLGQAQREIDRPLTATEIRAGVNLIQDVMRSVMKEGVHFGTIPGTPKPTLYKAGAEKICSTFRIAIEPIAEDLSTSDESRYRVTARALTQSGVHLGSGIGECSSNEAKYRWRAPVCDEEFEETPEDRRRKVWKRGQKGGYQQKQIRTEPADVANTILKMATKRAMIAVPLPVTAASDIFAQDIEDLPEELQREIAREDGGTVAGEAAFADPQPAAPAPQGPGIRVESVRVAKTGTKKNGDPYTLYIVKLTDDHDYSTFDDGLANLAKAARAKSAPVSFSYEDGEKGRKLTSIEEVR
jgi:hypothetical protein